MVGDDDAEARNLIHHLNARLQPIVSITVQDESGLIELMHLFRQRRESHCTGRTRQERTHRIDLESGLHGEVRSLCVDFDSTNVSVVIQENRIIVSALPVGDRKQRRRPDDKQAFLKI